MVGFRNGSFSLLFPAVLLFSALFPISYRQYGLKNAIQVFCPPYFYSFPSAYGRMLVPTRTWVSLQGL
jgi:hypothetical protein